MYISEVAPPQNKGLFGATTQIAINLGILFTLFLGYIFAEGSEWRVVLAAGVGVAVLQGFALCLVPESPAWLAANRDPETAVHLLQRIRGTDIDLAAEIQKWNVVVPKGCAGELDGLLHPSTYITKISTQIGFLEVMRNPLYRRALIAVVVIMVSQQFTGINSVMMYSVEQMSSLFPTTSTLLTVLLSLVNLLVTIFCSPLPDKLGRKPTLLLSISGMGFSSLALAFPMLLSLNALSVLSAIFYVAFFGVGLGAIPFILASELVDQEASSATQSWGLASNWIATFLVAQFCPMINDALNARLGGAGWVYYIFAALALVSAIFVLWRAPETKGKKNADEV